MKIFSDISLWWLLPALIFSIGISYLFYRNQKSLSQLSKSIKAILISLRALSLFIILFLLLGILFESKVTRIEKPIFITLQDNSKSMLNYKDSLSVKKRCEDLQKSLKEKFNDKFEFVNLIVDKDVSTSAANYKGLVTDLNAGFSFISNNYYNRNIGGICFISDGNYNEGQNPTYSAKEINFTPIFSLGVGDSLIKTDQKIKNVTTNDISFLGNKFPIDVDIEANKLEGQKSLLKLLLNGKQIASKDIIYNESQDFQHVTFEVEANSLGYLNYTLELVPKENEVSIKNNRQSVVVEVLDARSKILILAASPNPDITAIKSALDIEKNIEVKAELLSSWDGVLNGVDLVILQGLNNSEIEKANTKLIKGNVSALYLVDSQSSMKDVSKYNVGLNLASNNRLDEAQGQINSSFLLYELSEDVKKLVQNAPALTVPFGKISSPKGTTLISQRIGGVVKPDPIIYFGSNVNHKFGVVVGEGVWKWKLFDYRKNKNHNSFNELISKICQYLIVKSSKEPFRIKIPKKIVENQELIINAEFYNAALDQITSPKIEFEYKNSSNKLIKMTFAKMSKDYQLNLGKLKAGVYNWTASTTYNGKNYKKNGSFVVNEINVESLTTQSDFGLMRQLAVNSNGTFNELKNWRNMLKQVSERSDITNVSYEEPYFKNLIDVIWMLIILFLTLSAEWFLRRFHGTY